MSSQVFLALVAFCFASSITPGPNNLMLLASGVNFGFRRSIPHMLGIAAGFSFLLICVGAGLGELIKWSPMLNTALKFAGGAYLLYLAWRIASSGPLEARDGAARPMGFFQAAAFQWVNPKAWVMAVSAMAIYTSADNYLASVLLVTAIFAAVNAPSISVWCGMGTGLREFLAEPHRLRAFNFTMAGLLVLSLWPMLR